MMRIMFARGATLYRDSMLNLFFVMKFLGDGKFVFMIFV